MKIFTFITIALLCTTFLSAQTVPNGGFETWTDAEPDEWTTNNQGIDTTISQTEDSYTGTYAAMGRALEIDGNIQAPLLKSGSGDSGCP